MPKKTKKDQELAFPNKLGRTFINASLFAILFGIAPNVASAAPKNAEIVVDADTGQVLYEDNASAKRYPASITKVMTLYLLFDAIENGSVKLDDRIYFSKNASYQKPTKLGIKAGNSIDVETAIQALVIKSANDVAVAVAEHIGGSEKNFAKLMTDKAHQIGMINTNFANASGLPNPNQISTAEDLSKLAIAIRRDFPRQFHWFGRESFVFNGVQMNNHNHLVGKVDGVDGLKTGFTSASGYNLATTSVRDGKKIVTVVLGGKTWRSRDARVAELIETAYAQSGVYNANNGISNPYQYSFNNFRDEVDMQSLLVDASFGNSSMASMNGQFAEEKTNVKFSKPFVIAVKDGSNEIAANDEDEGEGEFEKPAAIALPPISPQKPVIVAAVQELPKPEIVKMAEVKTIESVKTAENELPTFVLKGTNDNETLEVKTNNEELPLFSVPDTKEVNPQIVLASVDITETQKAEIKDEIPADLAKIIADEEKQKQQEKIQLARLQQQKRDEARLAARKAVESEKVKQLAEVKAIEERARAAKIEKERQLALASKRGNVIVQVGAFKAKDDAQNAILKLAKNFPKFAKSEVSATKTSSGTWFRARFTGLAIEGAKQTCSIIVKTGAVCQIVSH